jgi:internalin A
MTRLSDRIRCSLVAAAILGFAASARADEPADLAALTTRLAMKFDPADKERVLDFPAATTDADLKALVAIKPKTVWAINLMSAPKVTDAGLAALTDLPGLEILKLPRAATDKALAGIPTRLPSLKTITAEYSAVTADGVGALAGAKKLTYLDLSGTPVKDDCWAQFAKVPNLESLRLTDMKLTGTGIKALSALERIRDITFYQTPIGDPTLKELAEIRTLRRVQIQKAKITDRGVAPLATAPALEELFLDQNPLTDGALKAVGQMAKLTTLSLRETRVTDAGLKHLTGAKNLTRLYLDGSKVTDEGIAQLKKDLPKCTVSR